MIVILKPNADAAKLERLRKWIRDRNLEIHESQGAQSHLLGLVGDTTTIDIEHLESMEIVDSVRRIQEPYKAANRKMHPDDTVVQVGDVPVGGGHFVVMAGPCSVESAAQITVTAEAVRDSGAQILRGGAFKPRTSPYAFQGLQADGLELLEQAKEKTGLPIVSEIMDISQLPLFEAVDLIQVGARNMQNFELLKRLGRQEKPVLLKRGLANTLQELLMSAEYILAGGNPNVILCERGIRTFETAARNTLDLAGVALLKEMTHLPVIVDPSHATGIARIVEPMALAATAAGADGLMIEVHHNPAEALCDGPQSLTPQQFDHLMQGVRAVRPFAWQGVRP